MMKITLFALAALAIVCAQEQDAAAAQPQQNAAPAQPQQNAAPGQPQQNAAPGQPQQNAAPVQPQQSRYSAQPAVQILKQTEEVDVDKYNFEFETSDGTSRQEQGEYKNDTDQQGLVVKGSYKYTAPDGQKISVSFVADKDGYKPTEDAAASEQPAQA